jgi:hypothetical protein
MAEGDEKLLLSDAERKAVLELIRKFELFSKWRHPRVGKECGEGVDAVGDMMRTNPKAQPSKRFALALMDVCKRHGMELPGDLKEDLGGLWYAPPSRKSSFISVLGVDQTIAELSLTSYGGDYLHFSLNPNDKVITTKFHLLRQIGEDGAPMLEGFRMFEGREVRSAGTYFCSQHGHLYLVSSIDGDVNLRMSVFDVIAPNRRQDPQVIIRGMVMGVGRSNTILSSHCVLVPSSFTDSTEELYKGPMIRKNFEKLGNLFPEIARAIFGEERNGRSKVIKQTPED